jgi:ABC-type Na+ transport system ATPase subunit NatA
MSNHKTDAKTANGQAPAVTVRDLEKRFGDFIAVNKVNFDVTRGEIFGFLGSNGAGKSTVIRMLVGLLAPSGGSGTVAGYDVSTEAEKIKKHIGYMSQRLSLYDDLTVVKKMQENGVRTIFTEIANGSTPFSRFLFTFVSTLDELPS